MIFDCDADPIEAKAPQEVVRVVVKEEDVLLGNVATIRLAALDTFGNLDGKPDKAEFWLNRPNRAFGGKTPLELAETDPHAVLDWLILIDHGNVAHAPERLRRLRDAS